jgi:hypothetical protein
MSDIDGPNQNTDLMTQLGVGSYNAANSALMGLPDFLASKFANDKYLAMKKLSDKNKLASNVGNAAGFVGSMFVPGGAIAKGAGAGLKAIGGAGKAAKLGEELNLLQKAGMGLEKVGQIASGANKVGKGAFAQGAAQGLASGLEQAVPRAFIDAGTTGDFSGIPGEIALGGLGGAGLGGVLGKAGKLLGKTKINSIGAQDVGETLPQFGLNKIREEVNKKALSDMGIDSLGLKKAVNALGMKSASSKVRNGDEYITDLVSGLNKRGVYNEKGFETLLEKNRLDWQNIDDAFAKNAPPTWNKDIAELLKGDEDLLAAALEAGDDKALDAFDKMIKEISGTKNLSSIRNKLGNIISDNLTAADPANRVAARIASLAKGKINEIVADMSGLGDDFINNTKQEFKLLQPFTQTEARGKLRLDNLFSVGSTTAEKTLAQKVATNVAGGGALGGVSAASDAAQGNDVDWGKALGVGAVGTLAGPLAGKAIAGLANKAVSAAGRQASKVMSSPVLDKVAEKLGAISTEGLSGKAGQAVGILAAESNPKPDNAAEQAASVEAAKPDGGIEIRRSPAIMRRLSEIYLKEYRDMAPEDFMARVDERIQGGKDVDAIGSILYPDPEDKAKFLTSYQTYQQTKGIDIAKALKAGPGTSLPLIGKMGGDPGFDTLREAMLTNRTGGDLTKRTPAMEKKAQADLELVRQNPDLLPQLMQGYGLDYANLAQLGVI